MCDRAKLWIYPCIINIVEHNIMFYGIMQSEYINFLFGSLIETQEYWDPACGKL